MADATDGSGSGRSFRRMLVVAVLAFAALAAVGTWLLREFDPFVMNRPEVRRATELRAAAQAGPLTDEQFAEAVGLLGCGVPVAQLAAVAIVQLDASKSPGRRGPAVEALKRCAEREGPPVGPTAGQAAGRLEAEPKKE